MARPISDNNESTLPQLRREVKKKDGSGVQPDPSADAGRGGLADQSTVEMAWLLSQLGRDLGGGLQIVGRVDSGDLGVSMAEYGASGIE